MLMDLIVNKKIDLKKLTLFLESLVEGKIFFRYFNKRPLTHIYKNFFTIVVQENNEYIGYGHLEKEKVFFGLEYVLVIKLLEDR